MNYIEFEKDHGGSFYVLNDEINYKIKRIEVEVVKDCLINIITKIRNMGYN